MVRLSRSECHQVAKVLQSYLDGEVEPATSSMVAAHLETCRKCGLEASTYQAIKAAIAAGAPEMSGPESDAVERLRGFAEELERGGGPSDHDR